MKSDTSDHLYSGFKKITIREIAKLAGVSVSTVSLVLNRKSHVLPATRKRIERIIKRYDYHPSSTAKNLARCSTTTLGMIVSSSHFTSEEQFYSRIFISAVIQAEKSNHYLLLALPDIGAEHGDSSHYLPRFLNEKSVDGIIMMGDCPDHYLEILQQKRLPLVLVDYYSSKFSLPCIINDNYHGGYIATRHLIRLGHSQPAFIGSMIRHPSIRDRYKGYLDAIREQGNQPIEQQIYLDPGYDSYAFGYQAGQWMASSPHPPDAVFSANDSMAIGCINALQESRLRVPEDIAVVGFDDIDASSQIDPKLTTIRVNKERMGELAVQKLVELISQKNQASEKITLPVELIIRNSCGCQASIRETIRLS
ncbi:MAG: LacI family DNA-binding transcriptional regulator [Candidatus Delongbacteria bacterium]|nr:LacI family DNA-binding transcriptional regulator [Candidatus Delongbacteria bacterium]